MTRKILLICKNAIVASLYAGISLILTDISFGSNGFINLRIAEILMLFIFISPKYAYGLIAGTLITNLFSPIPFDVIFGTLATILSCLCLYLFRNKKMIGIVLASLINGIIIGLEIYLLGLSAIGLFILLSITLGEFIVLLSGYLILFVSKMNLSFLEL